MVLYFLSQIGLFFGLRLEKKKPDKSADEKLEIQHESPPAKGTEVPQVSLKGWFQTSKIKTWAVMENN